MDDPLALNPETMRATGYRMVDLLVERVAGVREWPALTRASPLERDVLAHMGVDHPALLRVHPRLEHVAGRAGRLPR